MSLALDQLLHSLEHAARNQTKAEIGCGIFDHIELRMAAAEIRRLRESERRIEHDNKLLLAGMKPMLEYLLSDDAKTMHDAIQVAKRANAAYRHVSGT